MVQWSVGRDRAEQHAARVSAVAGRGRYGDIHDKTDPGLLWCAKLHHVGPSNPRAEPGRAEPGPLMDILDAFAGWLGKTAKTHNLETMK